MRQTLATICLAIAAVAASARQDQIDKARTLFDDARTALGGRDRLAAIKSLVTKGQARDRIAGTTGVADADFAQFDVELKVLFPDSVLNHKHRTDMPSPDLFVGYSGETLLSHFGPAPGPNWQLAAKWSPVAIEREGYALRILVLLLRADSGSPFTFVGSTADALTFAGGATIPQVRIEIDPTTHLPRRATYDLVGPTSRGAAPPSRLPVILEIGDYRSVGALQLPHRFEWHKLGLLQNLLQLQSIDIDANLTSSDFVKTDEPVRASPIVEVGSILGQFWLLSLE